MQLPRPRSIAFASALLLAIGIGHRLAFAQAPAAKTDVSVTIYSSADPAGFDPQRFISQQRQGYNPQYATQVPGFGVIKDIRTLDLKKGGNEVSFTDVAEFIDPTTVSLVDLTADDADAAVKVVEQNFQFDLVSPTKLLERYIDKAISVNMNVGEGRRELVTGTLLSANQGRLVLQTDKGLRMMNWSDDVQLPALPGGLITKPTLQWLLLAPDAGQRKVRTTYQTDGITWRADYNLVLNPTDTQADLGAWVTILNLSGAAYEDAQLKLIAGDVQRVQPQAMQQYTRRSDIASFKAADAAEGFQEKTFFEYHLYTLPRRTTISQNATQQIALFPTVRGVGVEKVLVYYGLPQGAYWFFPDPRIDRDLGGQMNKKVDVYIRFENKEANKLGIPLPRGKVRVFKQDDQGGDGALEFVGEDLIDHTPRNEKVLIKIGQAFDVTGERVQADFQANYDAHWIEESFRITLKNAKKEPQKVIIKENLYRWVNWAILKQSDPFEKIDARTVHFEVTVPADGSKKVEYTVRYSW